MRGGVNQLANDQPSRDGQGVLQYRRVDQPEREGDEA
jgi:hypothetical protein